MANHVRQQIRERVGTVLTGLTTTASRVYESRVYPLQDSELPALLIYTKTEESEPLVMSSDRVMERELSIAIECYAKANSNFDDTIDTICKEVEEAIAVDTTLNGLAKDIYIESTDIEFNADGESPVGYATLTFLTTYHVKETNPDVAV
tara:strand:+ start:355 stop:801 length:447 start_codon:yes stop_codon:yes gene_type:complete